MAIAQAASSDAATSADRASVETRAADTAVPAAEGHAPSLAPQGTAAAPVPLDSVKQKPLFGNWSVREKLAEKGVTFSARYVLEPAANTRGYRGTGLSVVQHVDVGASFDFGKLGIVDNGTLRIVVTDRIGDGLNGTKTGSYIQNQAFSGQGKNVRFNELSYEQTFLDVRLSLKGGFYPMGNDFGKLPYTCNFTNNGNCGHPLGPIYGSGWRDDPTGQWGIRLKWSDRSGWYAQAGVYDVNTVRNKPGHGFDLFSFDQTIGAFIPVEVGYNYGRTPSDYAGTVRIGAYYDTSRASVQGIPNATTTGRSGVLLQAAQQVWKPHPDTVRGVSLFGVATLSDRATGLFRTYFEAGASWRGLLAARPDDVLSFSWTEANINSRVSDAERDSGVEVQTGEQMLELNYGIQLTPWLLVRPDIQYLIRPGGYRSRPNTVVFGGHIQATL
jgi:porin